MAKKTQPPAPVPAPPPRSRWPWVILAFWLAWLAVMVYMSRGEWGRPRAVLRHSEESTRQERE